jgi:hypothetical protein
MFAHSEQAILRNDQASLFGSGALPLGRLGASVFLFLSGFGMFLSLRRREPLRFSYLFDKIFNILIIWIYSFIITLSIAYFSGCKYKIIEPLLTLDIPTRSGEWFIKVLLLCYVLSFLTFKFIKKPNDNIKILIVTIGIIAYILIAEYLEIPEHFYSTSLCFPFGMLFSKYSNKLSSISPRFKAYVIITTGFFCILFTYVIHIGLRFIIPFVFCVFFSYTSCFLVRKSYLKIVEYVGCYSLLYYWIHIGLNSFYLGNRYIHFVALFAFTSLFVLLYNLLKSTLQSWQRNE